MIYFFPKYTDVYNFADDTTSHACDKDLNSLINRLEHDSFMALSCNCCREGNQSSPRS